MDIVTILQVIVALAIIVLILAQERSSGVSGMFGGGEGGFYQARRGVEKVIFGGTIGLVALFAILSLLNLAS
jgi:protein translocase SecG subunit